MSLCRFVASGQFGWVFVQLVACSVDPKQLVGSALLINVKVWSNCGGTIVPGQVRFGSPEPITALINWEGNSEGIERGRRGKIQ